MDKNRKMDRKAEKEGTSFLRKKLHQYKWYSNLLPFLSCIVQVLLSLAAIMLPKIVLDAVQEGLSFEGFLGRIALGGASLTLGTLANMLLHNEIDKVSQTFLYEQIIPLWERKALSMKYQEFISGEGKIIMEKARNVASSPNWGIVVFLNRETAVLEAAAGLVIYTLVVGRLYVLLLLLLVVLFLAELGIGLWIEKKKQAFMSERAKAARRLSYIAYGTRGMKEAKDIRIYSMVPMLKEITRRVIGGRCKVESDIQGWQTTHRFVTAGIILIRDGIAYAFLILQYLRADMSIGDFSMYFAAITGIGTWLSKLSDAASEYKEVSAYVRDFHQFMKLPEEDCGIVPVEVKTPVSFEFKNVSFSYEVTDEEGKRTVPVIKNMNLKVHGGEKIAIVGVNGAGKSTLVKLLCGMLSPSEGQILINETDISGIQRREYYKLFSAVFQKSRLLPLSIAENILLDMGKEKGEAERKERMWQVLSQAGLKRKVESLPQQENTRLVKRITEGTDLSGGEEQRLFLARALFKNAPVLILDEPTAALDPISENEIYQKYNSLTEGKTAFFVSHRLASTRFCDRILYLRDGEIKEMGSHEELMDQNGEYADMFRVQSKYYVKDVEAV